MCNTYNTIGSLTNVKTHLHSHNIHEFSSLKEVIDFQYSYSIKRQEIIDHHTHLVELEIGTLQNEISKLENTINEMKPDASDEVKLDVENQLSKLQVTLTHPSENVLRKSFKIIETGISEITSQNHGFAVRREDVAKNPNVEITHINLNDDTVEGIRVKNAKAFSVQHHPEASPGPHDSRYLFNQFIEMMQN